jgi:integrase
MGDGVYLRQPNSIGIPRFYGRVTPIHQRLQTQVNQEVWNPCGTRSTLGIFIMPTLKLTQAAVDRLRPPANGRIEIWDTILPAFGLRIAAARPGRPPRKTWICTYRVAGRRIRETLGTTATVPRVDDARNLARASMQQAQAGVHPVQEKHRRTAAAAARQADTLGGAVDEYFARYAAQHMRPASFTEIKRTLERDVKPVLGARPIRDLGRRDVRELLMGIVDRGAPAHANHVLSYLRAMLNWAVSNDLIEANPAAGLKMPAPKVERDRALGDGEIRLFWLACDKIGWPFGPLFQFLLLTAQRRDEVAAACWGEFDLDQAVWTLPRQRTKNDRAHVIHLAPNAVEILRGLPRIGTGQFLFTTTGQSPVSGFTRARQRLAATMADLTGAEIEPFTLHDLRRTAATGMAGLGIAPHVVDRVLNHSTGKISGVARIYNRHEYLSERKAAVESWATHIDRLLNQSSNIVLLPRTG